METQRLLYETDDSFEQALLRDAVDDVECENAKPERRALVNLEGIDWILTTLVVTLDATLLELYQSEGTKYATFLTWFYQYERKDGWEYQLYDTLFIMLVAVVNVTLLIPAVNINVRTPPKGQWRIWLMVAWMSLLFVNVLTIRQCVESVGWYLDDDDHGIESWTAHFWLIAMAALLTVLLDVRFVYLYGVFTCFTCNASQALMTKQGLLQVYFNESGLREELIQERRSSHQDTPALLNVVKAPQLKRFNTGQFLEKVSSGFSQFVRRRAMLSRRPVLKYDESDIGSDDFARDENLSRMLESTIVQTWRGYILGKIKHAYAEVAEVENVFEYSSWIKAAAIFTVLMLIYNCIRTTEMFFKLASSWDDYHHLSVRFQHGMEQLRTGLDTLDDRLSDIKQQAVYDSGTLTSVVNETLPDIIQDIQSFQSTLDVLDASTGKAYDVAGAILNMALLTTAKVIDITDLKQNPVISSFFYIDSIIPILKYTCMVGYPIGTLIGFHSLYQVLVQHKRMSLALEQALATQTPSLFGKQEIDDEDAKMTLLGIDKKYQIGGAVYFFGILMSTAVVQQHIFGFFITLNVAIIADLRHFDILLDIGGYLIFVYVAVMLTNLFLTHVVGDRLLTKEGFQIRHPWLFFIYLFSFSMVHAVLGFLYALWRAVLLLTTTFFVLNRLDVSLFVTGKQFDNGHYSFMSMLLLTRVIRLTNISQGYIQTFNEDDQPDAPSNPEESGGNPSSVMPSRSAPVSIPEEHEVPPSTQHPSTVVQIHDDQHRSADVPHT